MSARIVTWNLERKRPDVGLGAVAVNHLFGLDADVMVLSEARTTHPAGSGHTLWCEPPRGTYFAPDERKVVMWSKQPWTGVDRFGAAGLDNTRFVSATTHTPIGAIRVLGVCIPWHMAEVSDFVSVKRKPWELHIRFLEVLRGLIEDAEKPTVVVGDFNQQVPRIKYGNVAAAAALESTFASMDIVTRNTISGTTRPGIDHIAVSTHFKTIEVRGWPNSVGEQRLSDHDGALADLELGVQLVDSGQ